MQPRILIFFCNFVCCTESLQQRFVLFVAPSHCNHFFSLTHCVQQYLYLVSKLCQKKAYKGPESAHKGQKVLQGTKSEAFLAFLDLFLATYTKFVCHSDPVRQTINLVVAVHFGLGTQLIPQRKLN